jgi:hypothetical protein
MIFNMFKTVFFGLLFLLFGFILMVKTDVLKENKISAIQIITRMDFVLKENGQIYDRRDTVLLCFFDDLIIYREQYPYKKYNRNAFHGDTVVISDDTKTIDLREMRYDYYVWKSNAKAGLKYSGDGDSTKIINVDSIKIKKMFKNSQFYNITHDKLEERKFSSGKKSFQEKYVNVDKPDESYCDTTYYTFSSDYMSVPYSLSLTADSIKKTKLIGVRYIYNAVPNGIENKIDLPRREMIFRIAKVVIDKPSPFIIISDKFKNDSKSLNLK